MPKRKRAAFENNDDRVQHMRKQDAQEKLTHCKKLLHRALKTAKGFERQKLGKRLTLATTNGKIEEIARINREIETLKILDLGRATDAHIHKILLKIKAFAESDLLPDEVRNTPSRPGGSEETVLAMNNITSGMYNTKTVKDTMSQVLSSMYLAMGIPVPAPQQKGRKTDPVDRIRASSLKSTNRVDREESQDNLCRTVDKTTDEEEIWNGFESDHGTRDDLISGRDEESLDEEDLSHYDALLGASSDEESFDEAAHHSTRSLQLSKRLSLSLSPTPSASSPPSAIQSESSFDSPEPQSKPPKSQTSKNPAAKVGGSTFLPTLMGGYWSGSEESASDLEDVGPPVRKNRPGQAARRAIWEKKFGQKANHIKSGQGSAQSGKAKDDGWDAKRGAKDAGRSRHGSRGSAGRGREPSRGSGRNYEKVTGENAVAVEPRGRGLGKKDDIGVLHPSWQAAKKAKELKKTATFQGTKVTF